MKSFKEDLKNDIQQVQPSQARLDEIASKVERANAAGEEKREKKLARQKKLRPIRRGVLCGIASLALVFTMFLSIGLGAFDFAINTDGGYADSYLSIYRRMKHPNLFANKNEYDITDGMIQATPEGGNISLEDKNPGYSQTNIQVQGVMEADKIKTDGKYIYALTQTGFAIYEAVMPGDKVKPEAALLCSADIKGFSYRFPAASTGMYIYGNKLVVCYDSHNVCSSSVFDITDINNPVLLKTVTQDGNPLSTRMIGSTLYTVSFYSVDSVTFTGWTNPQTYVPEVDGDLIDSKQVYCLDKVTTNSYIVVTALDIEKDDDFSSKLAVLGCAGTMYSTTEHLYLFNSYYADSRKTQILKLSLADGKIDVVKSATIEGTTLSQFSADEKDGYLRVAVTGVYSQNYGIGNALYVLDENLETAGYLTGIAPNETIKSVRFDGDYGYVVTFRQTDPLFAIDLSNPAKPTVTSELHIPGYSAYMQKYSDNLLLGIGFGGNEQGSLYGLKLSMFNTEDKQNVYESETVTYKEFTPYSVTADHKSALIYPQQSLIGIPNTEYTGCYYLIIRYINNEFILEEAVKLTNFTNCGILGVCIDNTVFIWNGVEMLTYVLADADAYVK